MSSALPDRTLLAFAAGALEPGPATEVRAAVERSPALQRRLAGLRRDGAPRRPRFRIPPPGIFGGRHPIAVQARPAAVMDAGIDRDAADSHRITIGAGGRWRVHIAGQGAPHTWMPVVLEQAGGADWRVTFPEDEDDLLTLADLPPSSAGHHRLDLAAPSRAGTHRFALALVPADAPIRWSVEDTHLRWAMLIEGLADGSVPVSAIEVRVEG